MTERFLILLPEPGLNSSIFQGLSGWLARAATSGSTSTSGLFAEATGPPGWAAFLPMLFLAALFYIMLIRPEKRRKEEHLKLVANLKKHDRVITIGGMYGMVANAPQGSSDVTLLIDEGSNTRVKVQRSAIVRVIIGEETAESEN